MRSCIAGRLRDHLHVASATPLDVVADRFVHQVGEGACEDQAKDAHLLGEKTNHRRIPSWSTKGARGLKPSVIAAAISKKAWGPPCGPLLVRFYLVVDSGCRSWPGKSRWRIASYATTSELTTLTTASVASAGIATAAGMRASNTAAPIVRRRES